MKGECGRGGGEKKDERRMWEGGGRRMRGECGRGGEG